MNTDQNSSEGRSEVTEYKKASSKAVSSCSSYYQLDINYDASNEHLLLQLQPLDDGNVKQQDSSSGRKIPVIVNRSELPVQLNYLPFVRPLKKQESAPKNIVVNYCDFDATVSHKGIYKAGPRLYSSVCVQTVWSVKENFIEAERHCTRKSKHTPIVYEKSKEKLIQLIDEKTQQVKKIMRGTQTTLVTLFGPLNDTERDFRKVKEKKKNQVKERRGRSEPTKVTREMDRQAKHSDKCSSDEVNSSEINTTRRPRRRHRHEKEKESLERNLENKDQNVINKSDAVSKRHSTQDVKIASVTDQAMLKNISTKLLNSESIQATIKNRTESKEIYFVLLNSDFSKVEKNKRPSIAGDSGGESESRCKSIYKRDSSVDYKEKIAELFESSEARRKRERKTAKDLSTTSTNNSERKTKKKEKEQKNEPSVSKMKSKESVDVVAKERRSRSRSKTPGSKHDLAAKSSLKANVSRASTGEKDGKTRNSVDDRDKASKRASQHSERAESTRHYSASNLEQIKNLGNEEFFLENRKPRQCQPKHREHGGDSHKTDNKKVQLPRAELSFSELNVHPLVAYYSSPSGILNMKKSPACFQQKLVLVSSATDQNNEARNNRKEKSSHSQVITKKESEDYDLIKFYANSKKHRRPKSNHRRRNLVCTENLIETSRKASENTSHTIGFVVEGIEPPKRFGFKGKTRLNEEKLRSLHKTVFSVIEIKSTIPNTFDSRCNDEQTVNAYGQNESKKSREVQHTSVSPDTEYVSTSSSINDPSSSEDKKKDGAEKAIKLENVENSAAKSVKLFDPKTNATVDAVKNEENYQQCMNVTMPEPTSAFRTKYEAITKDIEPLGHITEESQSHYSSDMEKALKLVKSDLTSKSDDSSGKTQVSIPSRIIQDLRRMSIEVALELNKLLNKENIEPAYKTLIEQAKAINSVYTAKTIDKVMKVSSKSDQKRGKDASPPKVIGVQTVICGNFWTRKEETSSDDRDILEGRHKKLRHRVRSGCECKVNKSTTVDMADTTETDAVFCDFSPRKQRGFFKCMQVAPTGSKRGTQNVAVKQSVNNKQSVYTFTSEPTYIHKLATQIRKEGVSCVRELEQRLDDLLELNNSSTQGLKHKTSKQVSRSTNVCSVQNSGGSCANRQKVGVFCSTIKTKRRPSHASNTKESKLNERTMSAFHKRKIYGEYIRKAGKRNSLHSIDSVCKLVKSMTPKTESIMHNRDQFDHFLLSKIPLRKRRGRKRFCNLSDYEQGNPKKKLKVENAEVCVSISEDPCDKITVFDNRAKFDICKSSVTLMPNDSDFVTSKTSPLSHDKFFRKNNHRPLISSCPGICDRAVNESLEEIERELSSLSAISLNSSYSLCKTTSDFLDAVETKLMIDKLITDTTEKLQHCKRDAYWKSESYSSSNLKTFSNSSKDTIIKSLSCDELQKPRSGFINQRLSCPGKICNPEPKFESSSNAEGGKYSADSLESFKGHEAECAVPHLPDWTDAVAPRKSVHLLVYNAEVTYDRFANPPLMNLADSSENVLKENDTVESILHIPEVSILPVSTALMSEESGYESTNKSKKSFKGFFKKSSNLLNFFKTSKVHVSISSQEEPAVTVAPASLHYSFGKKKNKNTEKTDSPQDKKAESQCSVHDESSSSIPRRKSSLKLSNIMRTLSKPFYDREKASLTSWSKLRLKNSSNCSTDRSSLKYEKSDSDYNVSLLRKYKPHVENKDKEQITPSLESSMEETTAAKEMSGTYFKHDSTKTLHEISEGNGFQEAGTNINDLKPQTNKNISVEEISLKESQDTKSNVDAAIQYMIVDFSNKNGSQSVATNVERVNADTQYETEEIDSQRGVDASRMKQTVQLVVNGDLLQRVLQRAGNSSQKSSLESNENFLACKLATAEDQREATSSQPNMTVLQVRNHSTPYHTMVETVDARAPQVKNASTQKTYQSLEAEAVFQHNFETTIKESDGVRRCMKERPQAFCHISPPVKQREDVKKCRGVGSVTLHKTAQIAHKYVRSPEVTGFREPKMPKLDGNIIQKDTKCKTVDNFTEKSDYVINKATYPDHPHTTDASCSPHTSQKHDVALKTEEKISAKAIATEWDSRNVATENVSSYYHVAAEAKPVQVASCSVGTEHVFEKRIYPAYRVDTGTTMENFLKPQLHAQVNAAVSQISAGIVQSVYDVQSKADPEDFLKMTEQTSKTSGRFRCNKQCMRDTTAKSRPPVFDASCACVSKLQNVCPSDTCHCKNCSKLFQTNHNLCISQKKLQTIYQNDKTHAVDMDTNMFCLKSNKPVNEYYNYAKKVREQAKMKKQSRLRQFNDFVDKLGESKYKPSTSHPRPDDCSCPPDLLEKIRFYQKNVSECQQYAQKVRIEAELRKEGHTTHQQDYEEVPLNFLLGRIAPTKKYNPETPSTRNFTGVPSVHHRTGKRPSEESFATVEHYYPMASERPQTPSMNPVEDLVVTEVSTTDSKRVEFDEPANDSVSSGLESEDIGNTTTVGQNTENVESIDYQDTETREESQETQELQAPTPDSLQKTSEEAHSSLTDKELFDKLLQHYEKEEDMVEKLSLDDDFFQSQLGMVKSKESAEKFVTQESEEDKQTALVKIGKFFKRRSSVMREIYSHGNEDDLSLDQMGVINEAQRRVDEQQDREIEDDLDIMKKMTSRDQVKVQFSKGSELFLREKGILGSEDSSLDQGLSPRKAEAKKHTYKTMVINDPNKIQPREIGKCFRRGFRPDNLALDGDPCLSLDSEEQRRRAEDMNGERESIIDFSERESPLEYLLGLGFSVDEASNAIKDEDVRNRLYAAITEARVWVNRINTTQGTMLYLVAYKTKPKTMRYFLQLVEAIINKRIVDAVKLDGFLKLLEKIEEGDISMVTVLGMDKFEDEQNEEKMVKKQLRQLFYDVYKIAEHEANIKNKTLPKSSVILLRILAAKYRAGLHPHLELIAKYIGQGLLVNEVQLEAAMIYLARVDTADVKLKDFEQYCAISCTNTTEEDRKRKDSVYSYKDGTIKVVQHDKK